MRLRKCPRCDGIGVVLSHGIEPYLSWDFIIECRYCEGSGVLDWIELILMKPKYLFKKIPGYASIYYSAERLSKKKWWKDISKIKETTKIEEVLREYCRSRKLYDDGYLPIITASQGKS